jgi:hypothetical protein
LGRVVATPALLVPVPCTLRSFVRRFLVRASASCAIFILRMGAQNLRRVVSRLAHTQPCLPSGGAVVVCFFAFECPRGFSAGAVAPTRCTCAAPGKGDEHCC